MGQEEYDKRKLFFLSSGSTIGYLRQDFKYTSQSIRKKWNWHGKDVLLL